MSQEVQQALEQAIALHASGEVDDAKMLYEWAIQQAPAFFEAIYVYAVLLMQTNAFEPAAVHFERALALRPDSAVTAQSLALSQMALGRHELALMNLEKAIQRDPENPEIHNVRGVVMDKLFRLDDTIDSFSLAIALCPDYAEAYSNRGLVYFRMKRLREALADCDTALGFQPNRHATHNTRASVLLALNRHDDALTAFDEALAIRPDMADAWHNRGVTLHALQQFDRAIASYNEAIRLEPNSQSSYFNKSAIYLARGDYASGLPYYEWRKSARDGAGSRSFDIPLWLGQDSPDGKTIFVHPEQGFGDAIQFCRYIPLLAQLGANVLFAPGRPLERLMRSLKGPVTIVDANAEGHAFDLHCPLMSLPLAFHTTMETIPRETPYLRAEPKRINTWKEQLGGGAFKIGVCWLGSRDGDQERYFPVAELASISKLPGVRLISLHKAEIWSALDAAESGLQIDWLDGLDDGPDAFLDTAAVISACDLVISCDTSIAHLSGALAAPTWLALKHVPEWRWMFDRDDSPWYPTMRLFRQQDPGAWADVFDRMEAELRELINRP